MTAIIPMPVLKGLSLYRKFTFENVAKMIHNYFKEEKSINLSEIYNEHIIDVANDYARLYKTLNYQKYIVGTININKYYIDKELQGETLTEQETNLKNYNIHTTYFPFGGYCIYIHVNYENIIKAEAIKKVLEIKHGISGVQIIYDII
jgi:hypothetical protein